MGRLTELYDYLNRDYEVSGDDKLLFTHLAITPELKRHRKKLARERKKRTTKETL